MDPRVVALLRCPHCRAAVHRDGRVLRCEAGHAADLARSGYVNLLGGPSRLLADTVAMVQARERVLAAGLLDAVTGVLVAAAARAPGPGAVVDLGAGTGHHTAALLDARGEQAVGLALDLSVPAAKRAARAHPRLGAVVCDVWGPLPVHDGVAGVVASVFAPRNPREAARVLRRDGRLVVVTPSGGHLAELVEPLGLVTVDPRKPDRLAVAVADEFALVTSLADRRTVTVTRSQAHDLVAMGPSAHHTDAADVARHLSRLPERLPVTIAVTASVYAPTSGAGAARSS